MTDYLDLKEEPGEQGEAPAGEVATEETAPVTTEEGAKGEEATEEGDKPKGKTGSQRQKEARIRAEQRADYLERELEAIKRQIAPPAAKTNADEPQKLDTILNRPWPFLRSNDVESIPLDV